MAAASLPYGDRPIKLERRGFKPTGHGTKGKCPHCGRAISHGLPGNPYARQFQPCQTKEIAAERARLARERQARAERGAARRAAATE